MTQPDGSLVTGQSTHEIYLIEQGQRRWIPDSWTMQAHDVSPENLIVLGDEELLSIPKGDSIPSAVPPAPVIDGQYYETESGVFLARGDDLVRVLDPHALRFVEGFDRTAVTYLPDSLVRQRYVKEAVDM